MRSVGIRQVLGCYDVSWRSSLGRAAGFCTAWFDPMPDLLILLQLLRLIIWAIATCAGSVGIYALVCCSLHPHPDAAVFAIVALISAIGITLGLPPEEITRGRPPLA
jgi:hypothetical protein